MCERQELDAGPSRAMWTELEMTRHGPCQAVDLHLCNVFLGFVSGAGCESADGGSYFGQGSTGPHVQYV